MKAWDWWRHGLCGVLAGGALLLGGSARAQECQADADCAEGFVCEGRAGDGCAVPDIACVDDDCPPPSDCDSTPRSFCVPAPCSDDSDCPASMVCYSRSYEACSTGGWAGCKPGEECAPPEPMEPVCETITESMCVPPHVPPCTADADCGPGFRCVEEIARGCSGSAGTGSGGADGGDTPAPPPPPPECFSEPTGNFICELQELPCETDDDCEAGLTCEANPNRPVCSSPGSDDGSEGAAPDRGACTTIDVPTHVCLPPNYASGWGRDLGGHAEHGAGAPTSGSDPDAPRSDDEETSNGDSNADPNSGPGESAEGPELGSDADGCSTTAAGSGNWVSLAGLLLLVGARRRRRG